MKMLVKKLVISLIFRRQLEMGTDPTFSLSLSIYIYISSVAFSIVWVLKYREERNENDKKAMEIHVLFLYYRTEKPRQCLTLSPDNTKTIERMTFHCFLRPIRRHLSSRSYTIAILHLSCEILARVYEVYLAVTRSDV